MMMLRLTLFFCVCLPAFAVNRSAIHEIDDRELESILNPAQDFGLIDSAIFDTNDVSKFEEIEAGPIWSSLHAKKVCPKLCEENGMDWHGEWTTKISNKMSVCFCVPKDNIDLPKSTRKPKPAPKPTPKPKPPSVSCGKQFHKQLANGDRIIGGHPAAEYSWPWQVLVVTSKGGSGGSLCGGSVINNEWIITAAHCISNGGGETKVYAGIYYLNDRKNGIRAAKKIKHENYNTRDHKNDIALIKLSRPLTFNDKIQPVCLPEVGQRSLAKAGIRSFITGWGRTETKSRSAEKLMEVSVLIRELDYCGFSDFVGNTQLCAGDHDLKNTKNNKGSCMGDSGGPLVVKNNDRYVLTGLVSFGHRDCNGQTIFTKVESFIDWIKRTMKNN